jgi:hypothetical protein
MSRPSKAATTRQSRALKVRGDERRGAVFISCQALADAAQLPTRRELIDRLFSIRSLRALRLDPVRGSGWLSFDTATVTVPEALEALAVALRARSAPRVHLPYEELLLNGRAEDPFEIYRAEHGLTLWRVEELQPGRFRLSHPLLRFDPIREKVLDALSQVAGVTRQVAPLARPGCLEVRCQPHRIHAGLLLEVIEEALADYSQLLGANGFRVREPLVAANLVLAPISDFLFPPLKVANAILVWLLNIEHVGGAWRGLRERRCTLELLYLVIGACTLLTLHFFGAAVMYAMLEIWPKLVRRLRNEGQRQFLARYRRSPRRVWVDRDGSLLEITMGELPAGETIVLREGDTVPGDGVILDGQAEVRESWITGAPGSASKQSGDPLYASTELSRGELRVRIDSVGERTAAGRLTSWYASALRQPSLKIKSSRLADAMVLPALLFGAAALARGGLHMTKAVIRPDYFTGPAIAEELSEMLTIIQAADAGFYIADQALLDRLADADCWIFDDSVPWTASPHHGAEFAAHLRSQGVREVLYLSSQPSAEAATSARDLGFDTWHPNFTRGGPKNFIAQRQFLGRSVAYFGDCAKHPGAAEQADVTIAVLADRDLSAPPSPITLLVPDLARCSALQALTQARSSSVGSAFAASLVPNVAAMSGAVYLDFNVLTSVILTNLGTLVNYYRWQRTLKSVQ